jgi:pyruvate decarboxylase
MYTVCSYLATHLSQIDLKRHFAVAGEYNFVLLGQLLTHKSLQQQVFSPGTMHQTMYQ